MEGMPVQFVPRVNPNALGPGTELACIVDVETTGLNPHREEIVELSLLLFAYWPATGEVIGVVDEYTGQREPGVPISREATTVHGLTKRQLKGLQLDGRRIDSIISRARLFIAHNATFDRGFCVRYMAQFSYRPWFCSMRGVPWRQRGFGSQGLQQLLRAHHIPVETAHRAGADTEALLHLLAHPDGFGRTYLSQVLQSESLPVMVDGQVAAGRQAGVVTTGKQESTAGMGCLALVVFASAVAAALTVHWLVGLLILIGGVIAFGKSSGASR